MEIELYAQIKQDVKITVDIEDIAEKINCLAIQKRYNFIASLINEIDLEDISEMTDEQCKMIANYLQHNSKRILEALAEKV